MKFIVTTFLIISQVATIAQTYRMNASTNGQTINLTCPVSGVRFADSGSNSTHYANSREDTLTFCAPSGKLLKFDFGCGSNLTIERIDPTDTLFIYNGSSTSDPLLYAITGNASNSDRLPYFDESSSFQFLSASNCITFRFKTDASNNNDGWDACVTCVDPISCGNNEPASDLFGGAPFICNEYGYCGTTSGDFGEDYPVNLNPNGGSCPSSSNFLGTIENNSWLKFIADSTAVAFDFNVPLGGGCSNGIQTAIFSYDGSSLTRVSDCALSDGSHAGTFQLTASGLTVGDTYYIMTDGNAGDVCDFTINVSSGVSTLDAGIDQEVCAGDPVNLTATGPAGATYVWNSTDGLIVNQSGASQTFNPLVPTTYYVEISGGGICQAQIDTVEVTICAILPITLTEFNVECDDRQTYLYWQTETEQNNDYFVVEKADETYNFQPIATINGAGNSTFTQFYQFIDSEFNYQTSYYRLKQVDYNGAFSYSEVEAIENCNDQKNIIHQLNYLSEGTLSVNYTMEGSANGQIFIYDLQGRIVFSKTVVFNSGQNEQKIALKHQLSNAIYVVKVAMESFVFTEKLMITK